MSNPNNGKIKNKSVIYSPSLARNTEKCFFHLRKPWTNKINLRMQMLPSKNEGKNNIYMSKDKSISLKSICYSKHVKKNSWKILVSKLPLTCIHYFDHITSQYRIYNKNRPLQVEAKREIWSNMNLNTMQCFPIRILHTFKREIDRKTPLLPSFSA